jgi:hypothetical protein
VSASLNDSDPPVVERVPLGGGAPRLISKQAKYADWDSADTLCLVTEEHSVFSIEYPPGRKIYTAGTGWISDPRVSPRGEIAFAEHPITEDDAGQVMVIDSSGNARVLSSGWGSLEGLAWNPSGSEIWFTAARSGVDRELMAVDLRGHVRKIAESPGGLLLRDISKSGQVLIARTTQRMMMFVADLDKQSVHDISWLDWSRAAGISSDGNSILFDETGSGGGKHYSVYLYRRSNNSAERLGDGRAMDLSPDGRSALTQDSTDPAKLSLISIPDRKSVALPDSGFAYRWAKFLARKGQQEILFAGQFPGKTPQTYRRRLPDGRFELVNNGMLFTNAPVVDSARQSTLGWNERREIALFDLAAGGVRSIKANPSADPIAQLTADEVLIGRRDNGSIVLETLNLKTGRTAVFGRLDGIKLSGIMDVRPIYIARNLRTIVYSRLQNLSDLFLVKGWK